MIKVWSELKVALAIDVTSCPFSSTSIREPASAPEAVSTADTKAVNFVASVELTC